MSDLLQEIRVATHSLLRSRVFMGAAVLTLALGIGANTAIFAVVETVLLRQLPYPAPDRLVVLWQHNAREGIEKDVTSYPNFSDWRSQNRSFTGVAAYAVTSGALVGGDGTPEEVTGAVVAGDFFPVLGVRPQLGQWFDSAASAPSAPRIALLSYRLWVRRFGSDPGLVGRVVRLNSNPVTVAGVMPPGFDYPPGADFWIPVQPEGRVGQAMQRRGEYWLSVIGRLEPGRTLDQAQQDLTGVARNLEQAYPVNDGMGITLEPLEETLLGGVREPLLLLLGAVGLVLLIACANVANLLLARGTARRRDVAVRLALGASRWQVVRQSLLESILLALAGGGLGVLLATWGGAALVAARPPGIPRLDGLAMNGPVLAFALVVSLATAILFGLAPALQSRGEDAAAALRESGRGEVGSPRLHRLRSALVVTEIALALVLLVGAGLLLRSFAALQVVDTGFNARHALTARVLLPREEYDTGAKQAAFVKDLVDRIAARPGVQAAAAITTLFLDRLPEMSPIYVEGRPRPGPGEARFPVPYDGITPGFFRAFGMRLLQGRSFTAQDRADAPGVAIVNEAFAHRFWPDGQALGRRITYDPSDHPNWLTVVGVVADARRSGLAQPVRAQVFLPFAQAPRRAATLVIRSARDPLALVPEVRRELRALNPDLPLADVATVDQLLAGTLSTRRYLMLLLGGFAATAAFLAAIGLYGVMSYLVGRRTREIGVRMALGASRGDIASLIVRQAAANVLPGMALGALGALIFGRLLRSQLFGVSAGDPLTFLGVATLLVGIAALASYLPARRAARTQPGDALRIE